MLAEYIAILRYTSAWRNLDLDHLKQVLSPDVIFDAPGIPFDVIGYNNVIEAHDVFFKNLREADKRLSEKGERVHTQSSYSVFTQIYPYEHKNVFPFMQLTYFTECGFLKLVYFFVDLDERLEKIQRIKTHRTKFMADSPDFKKTMKQVHALYGSLNTNQL